MTEQRKREPWFKFYSSDWRADPKLRLCSRAARGTWADMLSIMHEAEVRGELTISGITLDASGLAKVLGERSEDIESDLQELEAKGVFSRRKNGVIYSRRMVREEEKRRKLAENGRKGGNASLGKKTGNEDLLKQKPKPQKPDTRSQTPDKEEPSNEGLSSHPEESRSVSLREPDPPPREADAEFAVRIWNEVCVPAGLPAVRALNPARRKKAGLRIGEVGREGWREACGRLAASDFARGKNDRGWVANFEFLLSPEKLLKTLEGSYDNRKPAASGRGDAEQERKRAALDVLAERRGAGAYRAEESEDTGRPETDLLGYQARAH